MKIATTYDIISNYDARQRIAKSLTAGEPVAIVAPQVEEADAISKAPHSFELARDIRTGRAASTTIDEKTRSELNLAGLAVGGAAGAVAGVGIGVLLDQLKAVHPSSAPAFDAACALIGLAVGSAAGSNAIKFKFGFSLKEGRINELSVGIEGVKP